MSDLHPVENILQSAKSEGWPYPKTFNALKDAGVGAYEVTLEPYEAHYSGVFGKFEEQVPQALKEGTTVIGAAFNEDNAIKALRKHQRKETTYDEWVREMATAGVMRYSVDMGNRHVTYYGRDPKDFYREHVPNL